MRHRAVTPGAESNKRLDGEDKGLESKNSSTLDRKTTKSEKIPKSTSRELGHNGGKMLTDGVMTSLEFFHFAFRTFNV